jgi:hypothetical protein
MNESLTSQENDGSTPSFFSLLDGEDKNKYIELRDQLRMSQKRYKRFKRIESLQDSLDMIHRYCIRRGSDDWKRCLVCGVCWMGQDIAINTRQLRLLVDKCKSSINGALSKMGYGTAPVKSTIAATLLQYIPYLKGNFVEQRQWTVRRKIQLSPMPMRGGLPTPFVFQPSHMAYFVTPEPTVPSPDEIEEESPVDDLKSLFGFEDRGREDQQYNFITDSCCCCPVSWARNEEDLNDFFKFA